MRLRTVSLAIAVKLRPEGPVSDRPIPKCHPKFSRAPLPHPRKVRYGHGSRRKPLRDDHEERAPSPRYEGNRGVMSSSASKSSVAMIRVRWNYDQEIKVELRVWPKNFEDSAALTAVTSTAGFRLSEKPSPRLRAVRARHQRSSTGLPSLPIFARRGPAWHPRRRTVLAAAGAGCGLREWRCPIWLFCPTFGVRPQRWNSTMGISRTERGVRFR